MSCISLFSLPDIAIKEIFSYLSFDEVARMRVVNQDFNTIGKEVLNTGVIRINKFHALCLKEVKVQLPRRESERRAHPLARHVDVLTAIETRLSMLSMTYSKYIDAGLACFIPGKVLDETYRVLHLVRKSEFPPRPHEILQELRDISSMAMEHFDDKISPELKHKLSPGNRSGLMFVIKDGSSWRHSYSLPRSQQNHHSVPISNHVGLPRERLSKRDVCQRMSGIEIGMRKAKFKNAVMKLEIKALKNKLRRQNRIIVKQRGKIADNSSRISEQYTRLADFKRLVDECGHIFHSSSDISLPSTSFANFNCKYCKRKMISDDDEEAPEKKKKCH